MRFLVLLLLTACTSLPKQKDRLKPAEPSSQDILLFEQAFQNLGTGNYKLALPQFKKLAKTYKGHNLEWPVLYNLASTYKELGDCVQAKGIYEQLKAKIDKLPSSNTLQTINLKTPDPIGIKPRIYLSLSYTHECLGKRKQSLMALKTGELYINQLPKSIRLIEYPARLFLAHIAVGDKKTGLKIQKQLYQNLESVKNAFRISQSADENFAHYFYTIGRSHTKAEHVSLNSFLKVFPYHQAYLLQAVLLKTGKWSVLAEAELGKLYRKMWVALKAKKKSQKSHLVKIHKILDQLKSMAQSSKNKKVKHIYQVLRKKTLPYLD